MTFDIISHGEVTDTDEWWFWNKEQHVMCTKRHLVISQSIKVMVSGMNDATLLSGILEKKKKGWTLVMNEQAWFTLTLCLPSI